MEEYLSQVNKSANSFKALLDKLEADGYLKSRNELSISEFIFNDIVAFLMLPVFCNLDVIGKEKSNKYLVSLTKSFGVAINEKAFNDFIMQYASQIGNGRNIYPEGFITVNNFDFQAMKDNNKFYETMKVYPESPMSDYYILLIESALKIADHDLGDECKVTVDFINASIDAMRSEQVSK